MLAVGVLLSACSSPKELSKEGFRPSETDGEVIAKKIPDYSAELHSLKGKGRAIVSEPSNTERVRLRFSSNRQKSLVTVRNNLGIEGGQLLTDGDTLLVYNKVDKYARKIPIRGGNLDRINKLASLNILDIINYSIDGENITGVLENPTHYKLLLSTGAEIYIDKKSNLVAEVIQPDRSQLPYSKIEYSAYSQLKGYFLPQRITIFGTDKKSKIALQLTSLDLNPQLDPLNINLPEDIRIYYR